MPRLKILFALAVAVALLTALPVQAQTPTFRFWSDDIANGRFAPTQIYDDFGCSGGNVSPHLAWSGAPKNTRSFVITMFDPDAPTGSGFWHWIVANIPASASTIATGASRSPRLPAGAIETRTDFGITGYGGPCPPAGSQPHRYVFTIHALTVERIDVNADMSGALVGFMTNANRLGSASFTAMYGR